MAVMTMLAATRTLLSLLLCVMASAAFAQTNAGQTRKWTRFAAGTQQIRLHHAAHVKPDCEPMGEIRMAIPEPPKNGKLEAIWRTDFTDFGDSADYKACATRKTEGLTVYYRANEGFKGKETFSFLIVFSDGGARRYEIDMTVY